jgi:sigma-B regulation protein RsbU (phosphoserine phosphatase)
MEGDMMMLFTDGLYEVEGANEQLYSAEKLVDAVRRRNRLPAGELFDQLLAEIKEFALDKQFTDDVCLVGLEVAGRK